MKELKTYKLVRWPESQDYMDEPWFEEEAVLFNKPEDSDVGPAAYLIPVERLKKEDYTLTEEA